jgi:hypothetical protein
MGQFARLARRAAAHFIPQLATPARCAGCGRSKDDVAHLVSGPGVYLCGDCFTQASQQLTPRRPPLNALRCRFCRQLRSADDVTHVGAVGVCADCLGVIDLVLAEARESSRPAT